MTLRSYLNFISRAPSLEALWSTHTKEMARYGFDRLLYGYTRYRTETSLGDPDDFVILTNHSKDYVDRFMHGGLYFDAPMLHWALKNEGAESWRMINQMMASQTFTPQEQMVYDFNHKMNVTAGYTISFNSVSVRSKGAISLCARPGMTQTDIDEIWKIHGEDILLMNNIAHLKILTLPHVAPKRSLTKRQREALEWVGDGKTMQDIAVLMGLTSATVEKHLRLAREALAVETTAQAVMKAALHNQMFVIEA
ncbi:LuxR family transcriptional regulator [Antarcticimicrobium sediminis]|uniref:LuxR family transcriptional regulator n=1 Tax=Antarcticimicrobium sediminis TaxID=2546227 RepID=A0A4R5EIZ7_9RHOB|nr:LuxR family transcriptional regulator [Antarcticimicrobium sediminis]TDE34535.1 LuxR family transcriptional regulator [Antarcticimicrobium sediminis]